MRTGGFGRHHERGEQTHRKTRGKQLEEGTNYQIRFELSDPNHRLPGPGSLRWPEPLSSHKTAHTLWALTYNRVPCPQLSGTDFTISGAFHFARLP